MAKLKKAQTGISAEFLAAGELSRRGFNVAMTFGNTKSIDILVEVNGKSNSVQVKGIQSKRSICWNIKSETLKECDYFILINLNTLDYSSPEYFVLDKKTLDKHLKRVKSGRHYIDYNYVKRMNVENSFEILRK